MNEPKRMHRLDGKHALCDIESRHILRESVVLDQHGHEITPRKEFHDQVQVRRVLEGVVELDDPWRVGFSENIALCANMGQL